jgi:hypothetical protein
MAYFIFIKETDGIENSLSTIAENQSDLNNLNLNQQDHKIIEDSQENFNAFKYGIKLIKSYNNNTINYENRSIPYFKDDTNLSGTVVFQTAKENLRLYINDFKTRIQIFTKNNQNHPLFNRWNNYYNQLNSLDINLISHPLNTSLETYFNNLGQPSYHILQIP